MTTYRFLWLLLIGIPKVLVSMDSPNCYKGKVNYDISQKNKLSDQEVFRRLVFAEGISANAASERRCQEVEYEIFEAIAWGVISRVDLSKHSKRAAKKYGRGLQGVIFKAGQFNPAISRKSRFAKFFRCPTSVENWERYWKWATRATNTVRLSSRPSPLVQTKWEKKHNVSLVSHFYYPLSTQATPQPPVWADTSAGSKSWVRNLTIAGKNIPNHCIWFFRHERPFRLEGKP